MSCVKIKETNTGTTEGTGEATIHFPFFNQAGMSEITLPAPRRLS
jgi:hypothetical protein